MGDSTKIPYVDYTWNPWLGCEPVHTGCLNCYAKRQWPRFEIPEGRRKRAAESTLRKPLVWNRKAEKEGVRRRVMCGSLMDLFEDHPDVAGSRRAVFRIIQQTPHLDWIIPTKRPERVFDLWPRRPLGDGERGTRPRKRLHLSNVCVLASVSDQKTYDAATLCLYHARNLVGTLGLSIEPLVGPIEALPRPHGPHNIATCFEWLVIGGESGPGARPCHVEWIRDLVEAGRNACVAVYVKQLGDNAWENHLSLSFPKDLQAPKGGDPEEWPSDLRIRQFPT